MSDGINSVEVFLIEEWLGHAPGSVLRFHKIKADELVGRGVARFNNVEEKKPAEIIVKKEEVEIKPKSVGRPPKDKMIKTSKNKAVKSTKKK